VKNPTRPLSLLDAEVKDGLSGQSRRWMQFERESLCYDMRAVELLKPRELETATDFDRRPKLNWRLTRRVVKELGKGLYGNPPRRTLEGAGDAAAFYDQVVVQNDLDALMGVSDRMTWLHGVFAIQVSVTGNPMMPIRLDPWGADEFAVWLDDDDPRTPWAVCVKSLFTSRRQVRFQLWSDTEVRTFWTEPGDMQVSALNGSGNRVLLLDGPASMPHGLGCLPFVFFHNEPAVKCFWTEGLGRTLAETDVRLSDQLSDLAQAIQVHAIPPGFIDNVAAASPFVHRGAGGFIDLTPKNKDRESKVFYVQPQLFVAEVWMHLLHYSNQTLQDLDLPLIANLESMSSPESGVAIAARRTPLIDTWRARQKPFAAIEGDLAKTILTVAGHALNQPGLVSAAESELQVVYPEPQLPLPTPERDDADERAVGWGIKSRIMMVQERYGMTRDAALEHLMQVEADRADEERILGPSADQTPASDATVPIADDGTEEEDTQPGDASNGQSDGQPQAAE
jgi:hypothetical protein